MHAHFAYLNLNRTFDEKHTSVKRSLKIEIVIIDNHIIELITAIGY